MSKRKPKLRILLVEDDPKWQQLMEKEITLEAKGHSFQADIVIAETSEDAFDIAKSQSFHGISLDQNMPRFPGDKRDQNWGRQLMLKTAELNLASYICVFTLYPSIDISNDAGSSASIPYKVKAADTSIQDDGINRMDAVDYCEFFVLETYQRFLLRALERAKRCGFADFTSLAANCEETYENFRQSGFNQDSDAKSFFFEFGRFRERFNKAFVSLTRGIAASRAIQLDTLSAKSTASKVEIWINRAWTKLEENEAFENEIQQIRKFFQLEDDQAFSDYFVTASSELREPRNISIHQDWTFTPEEFMRLKASFLRYGEIVAFVSSLPMIVQPRMIGSETISFTNVNYSRPRDQVSPYNIGSIPEVTPTRVFTRLPGGSELIPLDGGIIAKRDPETNRLVLEEVGLRK